MNPNGRHIMQAAAVAAVAAAAALSTGCASQMIGGGTRPEQPVIPGEVHSELTKADADLLAASVVVAPESDDAAALAARVKTATEATLVGNGFKLSTMRPEAALASNGIDVPGPKADVIVAMTVRQSTFDKSGNYYLLEGSVPAAKVVLPNEGSKIAGSTQFSIVRGERLLGMDRAVASLGDNMVPAVEQWVADTVKPSSFDMSAVTIVIRRKTIFYKSKDPIYVNRFAETIAKMDGVYSCELVAGDALERLWEYRVVYRKKAFPGGLVNKVISVCKDLDIELDR